MEQRILEKKAAEVLSRLEHPQTIDPVANDTARTYNIQVLVEAMRWSAEKKTC